MNAKTDHDILIEMRTDIRYIKKNVGGNTSKVEWLKEENQERKDWQENFDGKTKTLVGVATFVGGIIVFLGNKLWDVFITK